MIDITKEIIAIKEKSDFLCVIRAIITTAKYLFLKILTIKKVLKHS